MYETIIASGFLAALVVAYIKRRTLIRLLSGKTFDLQPGTGKKGPTATVVGPFHCPACENILYVDKDFTRHSNLLTCPYCGKFVRMPKMKFKDIEIPKP